MKPVILSLEQHRNTRIVTARGAQYGENVQVVPVIANELRSLAIEYPVVLLKDEMTGRFGLHALLGFDHGENLYLQDWGWDAVYVPLHIRRQPFLVGRPGGNADSSGMEGPVISLDMTSSRVQETDGEALFCSDGSWTPYLREISKLLAGLTSGAKVTEDLIATLSDHDLIEPIQLNVTFSHGIGRRFDGLYTVSEQKLRQMSDEAVKSLNGMGFLQACYLMLASLGNIQKLVEKRNRKGGAATHGVKRSST